MFSAGHVNTLRAVLSSIIVFNICRVSGVSASTPAGINTSPRGAESVAHLEAPTALTPCADSKCSTCECCGAPLKGSVAGEFGTVKDKDQSLITDSLWGNLILELAYQRDPELNKLAKKVRRMNSATTISVLGLAGATLAQGISALYVLNPPSGLPDSYAPLNIGVATSGAMLGIMSARVYCGHKLESHLRNRQLQVKERVQAVLAHIEYSHCRCEAARSQLITLIGPAAGAEWVQLWQSKHQQLAGGKPNISI